jgi:hypothetical protein
MSKQLGHLVHPFDLLKLELIFTQKIVITKRNQEGEKIKGRDDEHDMRVIEYRWQ